MVVQAKNANPRRSSLSVGGGTTPREPGGSELLSYYLRTLSLKRISMSSIPSIFKPVLVFVMIFGSAIGLMFCLEEVTKGTLNLFTIIIKTVTVVCVCVIYGMGSGIFFRWLLSKSSDTSQGSYIFVCLLSLIFSPVFLILDHYFPSGSWIFNILNAMLASFILEINLVYDHSFVDSRARFIYKLMETAVVWIFLLLILPALAFNQK